MRDDRRRVLTVAVLLAVLTGCGGGATDEPKTSTASGTSSAPPGATASPFPYSTEPVAIDPGTSRISSSAWSSLDYTVTIPKGWTVQYGASYRKHSEAPDGLGFEAFVPDTIYADACEGSQGELMVVAPASKTSPRRCSSSGA